MTGNTRRWTLLVPALAVIVAACGSNHTTATPTPTASASPTVSASASATPSPSASAQYGGLPDPKQRILLGTYINLAGQPDTETAIQQRESAMGRRYDLELTYYNWNDPFPDAGEATIAAHGRTPLMT